ncbi:uncharacterized protein LOC133922562 [Phragmites australis]|uniref:uncharacterized protein LOC133922562 n=1 Tax=Phragmites australis TaxID=29695 RepID=UPI002D78004A|nr:uncharacterized protein LOC133922562 [Phragmites australis]
MDGDQRRQAAAVTRARVQDSPARRLIAWLQLRFKAFVHRCGKLARWDAAGRPVFVLFAVFLLQRSLRRRYLSWKESSELRLRAAAVTVQAAVRAIAARRELSLRRQARAATRIQAQWRAHIAVWSYLMTKRATLICQCALRRNIARRQLLKLRLANLERERLDEMCTQREMVDVLVETTSRRPAEHYALPRAPSVILVSWTPPPLGWYKLNFDGSVYHDETGRASIGGVIRDCTGHLFLCFAERTELASIGMIEGCALIRGLHLALESGCCDGHRPLLVEGYDRTLVRLLRGESRLRRITRAMKEEILELLGRFRGGFEVRHIFREGNQVADTLCREAYRCPMVWNVRIDGPVPSYAVWEKAEDDRRGVVHERIRPPCGMKLINGARREFAPQVTASLAGQPVAPPDLQPAQEQPIQHDRSKITLKERTSRRLPKTRRRDDESTLVDWADGFACQADGDNF